MEKKGYFAQFESAERISRGMSGDEKYRVTKDGAAYLLRVSDEKQWETKKREYEYLRHLSLAGLDVPGCFGIEKLDGQVYTLLSWVEGEEAEKILPRENAQAQYEYGLQAGRLLRRVHENSPAAGSENWYDIYFGVIEPRISAYRREGIPFDGAEEVLKYIDENSCLLKARPVCRHHGDYHTGNLIVNAGKIWAIDWHTVDFDNMGDPWYEFNRMDCEHVSFAKGQTDGYFEGNIPEEFWRLFALYFAASAITSIVWAKHWAPQELENIMALNKSVQDMFDGMKNPVPAWYRK